MAKKATLKTRTNETLYPQTVADTVLTTDNNNVQAVLNSYGDRISAVESVTEKNKGWYASESALLSAYPNNISHPENRKGWYAIVAMSGDDKLFIWDVDDNRWVNTDTDIDGIQVINGKSGTSVTLYGTDIKTTSGDTQPTITESLTSIGSDITTINGTLETKADETDVVALQNLPKVLYLTSTQLNSAISQTPSYTVGQLVICVDDLSQTYKSGTTYKYISVTETVDSVEVTTYNWEKFSTAGGIEELEGTYSNPIILYNLEAGTYLLKGYFKFNSLFNYKGYVNSGEGEPSGSVIIIVGNTPEDYTRNITVVGASVSQTYNSTLEETFYCFFTNSGAVSTRLSIVSTSTDWVDTSSFDLELLKYYNGYDRNGFQSALSTTNSYSYTPTGQFHPATKKYVDDSIENSKPISEVENPSQNAPENSFVTSTSTSDNRLFYGKKSGLVETYITVDAGETVNSLYIDKSIASHTFESNDGAMVLFSSSIGANYFIQILVENNQLLSIKDLFSSGYIYQNGSWYDNISTGYVDIFPLVQERDGSSTEVTWMKWDSGEQNEATVFLKKLGYESSVTPTQIALQDDVTTALSTKQDLLNSPATAGKVLTSTSTEGTMEWTDKSLQKLNATNNIDLATISSGVYEITGNGKLYTSLSSNRYNTIRNGILQVDATNKYFYYYGEIYDSSSWKGVLIHGALDNTSTAAYNPVVDILQAGSSGFNYGVMTKKFNSLSSNDGDYYLATFKTAYTGNDAQVMRATDQIKIDGYGNMKDASNRYWIRGSNSTTTAGKIFKSTTSSTIGQWVDDPITTEDVTIGE